ncbi:hypothetical protein ACTG5T_07235 [Pasteurella multocida]
MVEHFGLSVGISERGTTAFNVRGGRAEQKHYNATQKSTLSGVDTSQANVSGQVNTDLAKAKAVTRDDTYASTQFSFEVADIVELGQRAKNKLSAPNNDTDMAAGSTLRSRSTTEEADVPTSRARVVDETDSISVKNPIYESAEAVVATPRSKNVDSASVELVDNPLYGSATPRSKVSDTEVSTAKVHAITKKSLLLHIIQSVIMQEMLLVSAPHKPMSIFMQKLQIRMM